MVSGIRNDNWLARHNSVRLFGRLLAAGVEIQEFNRTMLHHKTMVVDRRWVTVGTTNFDNRSFAHNEESNVCFFDRGLADELNGFFRGRSRRMPARDGRTVGQTRGLGEGAGVPRGVPAGDRRETGSP